MWYFFVYYFCISQSIYEIIKVMVFTLNIYKKGSLFLSYRISVMSVDNLSWNSRIGVFQSAKNKSFNIVSTDPSVNLGNQELSGVYLSICALLLICASTIFNGIVNNFEKCKFLFFLNVDKTSFLLSPKSIFNFYFYI